MKTLLLIPLFAFYIFHFTFGANAASFPDIKSPALSEAVDYLVDHGIISGYPDGTFKPEQTINRAEALKIIFLSLGKEEALKIENSKIENSPFPDVDKLEWYATFVHEAKTRGIISGYGDGTYKPTQFVNKVEFVKIAMLAQSYYSQPSTFSSEQLLNQFTDLDPSEWYLPTLAFAFSHNFLDKTSRFNPTSGMTRGDAAMIIYRVVLKNEEVVVVKGPCTGDTCVNDIDVSQFDWWTDSADIVEVKDGKLYINGYDYSSDIGADQHPSNILLDLERQRLAVLPIETKLQVDQLYPELYARAIGLHGGIQDGDEYYSWSRSNKYVRNIDGEKFVDCDCKFESYLITQYAGNGYPPFEEWMKTNDAKGFIYDIIYYYINHPEYAK